MKHVTKQELDHCLIAALGHANGRIHDVLRGVLELLRIRVLNELLDRGGLVPQADCASRRIPRVTLYELPLIVSRNDLVYRLFVTFDEVVCHLASPELGYPLAPCRRVRLGPWMTAC